MTTLNTSWPSKTSAKIDELRRRKDAGDKYLNSEHGWRLLDYIERLVEGDPKFDALALWMAREGKKGRLEFGANRGLFLREPDGSQSFMSGGELGHLADFAKADPRTNR